MKYQNEIERPLNPGHTQMLLGSIKQPILVDGHRNINKYTNSIQDIYQLKISSLVTKLSLPIIIEQEAFIIYKKAIKKNIKRKYKEVYCIYLACRIHQINKSLDDIIKLSRHPEANVRLNDTAKFAIELDIILPQINYSKVILNKMEQNKIPISRYNDMIKLIDKIKSVIHGSPKTQIGVALYIILNKSVSQRDLAEQLQIAEFTLREGYRQYVNEK